MARGANEKGLLGRLKDTAGEAALVAALAPVAKRAVTKAARFAVRRGPRLVEKNVLPRLEEAGGPKGLLHALGSWNGAGDGVGEGRRLPIQRAVDVAAPLEVVYDQFTQFEEYPEFMHRLESVEQLDEEHVEFHGKIWGIDRRWEAEIVEQRPDERIVWRSVSGLEHMGVVTFHELSERLTRVELNLDIEPRGPIERLGRGLRFAERAARADLMRFKAYVEMYEEPTGSWRGVIENGEVVEYVDEDEEDYVDEDDEYDDDEDLEEEDEDLDEDEEFEEVPAPRGKAQASRKRGSSKSGGSSKSTRGSPSSKKNGSSSSRSRASTKSSSASRRKRS